MNPNEIPLTGYFCELEEDLFTSMPSQQHIDINDPRLEGEQRMVVTNVAGNTITPAKENVDVVGDINGITENPQQCEKTRENGRSGIHLFLRLINSFNTNFLYLGQHNNGSSKRKNHARIEDPLDVEDFVQVSVRHRSSHVSNKP